MSNSPKPSQQAGEPQALYLARLKAWENGEEGQKEQLENEIAADSAKIEELKKQEEANGEAATLEDKS